MTLRITHITLCVLLVINKYLSCIHINRNNFCDCIRKLITTKSPKRNVTHFLNKLYIGSQSTKSHILTQKGTY